VQPVRVTAPALTVTGTVVASLRPGNGGATGGWAAILPWRRQASDYWQFNAPEVLSTYTDWQKAKADITFAKGQFTRVRDAAIARTAAQRDIVATMVKLAAAGTETKKQLAIEQATLRQYEIQEDKEIYEAETAIRMAVRAEAAAARQLQQAGLDPPMLGSLSSDVDLVMADVPEGYLSRVKIGDGCQARFFAVPDQVFPGRVKSIAQVITRDRRSLRVLFTVEDLRDQLRPGMFAEIGLGTDPRSALLAPAEGVIHVGRTDYVLVATPDANVWRATPVEVGEMRDGRIEVVRGLSDGNRVIGQGAILLKPAIVRAVQPGSNGAGGAP
jgi:multidrug efflux pump subunit AcrA (membrane-fusion protein)